MNVDKMNRCLPKMSAAKWLIPNINARFSVLASILHIESRRNESLVKGKDAKETDDDQHES